MKRRDLEDHLWKQWGYLASQVKCKRWNRQAALLLAEMRVKELSVCSFSHPEREKNVGMSSHAGEIREGFYRVRASVLLPLPLPARAVSTMPLLPESYLILVLHVENFFLEKLEIFTDAITKIELKF
jgi:hypothetical protein